MAECCRGAAFDPSHCDPVSGIRADEKLGCFDCRATLENIKIVAGYVNEVVVDKFQDQLTLALACRIAQRDVSSYRAVIVGQTQCKSGLVIGICDS